MKGKFLVAVAVLLGVVLVGLKLFRPVPAEPPASNSTPVDTVRRSPPRRPVAPSPAPAESTTVEPATPESNLIALYLRLFGTNGLPDLKPEQLETYLKENHRSAQSLLAVERATGDRAFLREAMEKYPNDPHVAFEAYFRGSSYDREKAAPEETRKWLDALRRADPNNALGDYLSARDHFKSGQTELALQELQSASGKSAYQDYSLDFLQASEEAYRAAGYSEAPAKWAATSNLLLPTLYELKYLSLSAADLVKQYQQAGDTASAQAVQQMGFSIGERCYGPGQFPLINTLVGIAIDKIMLGTMDPTSPYSISGNPNWTAQNQIDALNQQRADIKELVKQSDAILPTMSDQDLINFRDRERMLGEAAAMRWAVEKYGAH
jgi:hypothetical protein